jgi:hypothetical protein
MISHAYRHAAEVPDTSDAHCAGCKSGCHHTEIWSGDPRGQLCSRVINQL